MRTLLFLLLVSLPLGVNAQDGELRASSDLNTGRELGVVRVKNITTKFGFCAGPEEESFGSGTIIGTTTDNTGIVVLSCAHVYRERGRPQVEVGHRVWKNAVIKAIDHRADLSLLICDRGEYAKGIPVATSPPSRGEELRTRGYPSASMFIERPCSIVGEQQHLWRLDCRPISGESGGCLVSKNGVVGVVVMTEGEDPDNPNFNPGGYVVGWQAIRRFVDAAFPNQYSDNEPAGLFRRSKAPQPPQPIQPAPLPGNDLADMPPPNGGQAQQPPTAAPQPESPQEPPPPPPIDWSLAKVVVVVPRQEALDRWDWLVRTAEKLTAKDSGPGQYVRRALSDASNGKIDVEVIYERTEPQRYEKTITASGLMPGKYAGVVVLVRSQQESMFEPIRNMVTRYIENSVKAKLGEVPLAPILERTAPAMFQATMEAIEFKEPESSSPGSWLTALAGMLFGPIGDWIRKRKELASTWTLS